MDVWRPCDTVETAVAWARGVERARTARRRCSSRARTCLSCKREPTWPSIARGGYVLSDAAERARRHHRHRLGSCSWRSRRRSCSPAKASPVRVVSMPSTSVFDRQDAAYGTRVLPRALPEGGGRGRRQRLLAQVRRPRRAPWSASTASANRRRRASCSSISASPPRERGRGRQEHRRHAGHDHQGCDQRIRPHRPQGAARPLRGRQEARPAVRRDQRPRRRRRPTRICSSTTPRTASSRARWRSTATAWSSTATASRSSPSAIRPSCRGRRSASTWCWNAPASSPARRRRARTCRPGAKKVIISAPGEKDVDRTVVFGVNHKTLKDSRHGDLERLVHHQLPRAAGQGARRPHRRGLAA